MKKLIENIWEAISYPFVMLSIVIDEDRNANLDGRYDKYWARRNAREMRKAARR